MSRKDAIIERLKENGCRITKQRKILIDIILENDCTSCKDIFYKASREDKKIGVATVYRMINALEEIGAISRKNMYRVACGEECENEDGCEIILEDDTVFRMPKAKLDQIVQDGARQRGYLSAGKKIAKIIYHDRQT
ncbi:transcriptional repressor [Mordavella massiliensis]|uniref:Transcriptional repressor n=1 Tax=Mordavella massiliensis TaxID=1871024 RepID=A0A938X8X6_9CLOT|nr:transcriptional repressor [Mordavella massiliensis]